jgi:hypothetical protein
LEKRVEQLFELLPPLLMQAPRMSARVLIWVEGRVRVEVEGMGVP